MNNPKPVIVFDLGKVLLDFDYQRAVTRIAAQSSAGTEAVRRHVGLSPLLFEFETGRIDRHGFLDSLRKETGYHGTRAEFEAAFGDIFTPIEPMIRIHAGLREAGYPTWLFSNTNELAIEFIRRQYPFYATFDGHVLSYEHGVMKPEAGLYEVVERRTGRSGPCLIYLDDRPENVATALARGWQGHVFRNPSEATTFLDQVAPR